MMRLLPRCLVSACLCGMRCRYDGALLGRDVFARLVRDGIALPVCPELLGGLPVPRPACEMRSGRVVTADGEDRTEAFLLGARRTLALARRYRIREAVFKEFSPSCGCGMIFDGSFSGRLTPGQGVTTMLLRRHGITVRNEEEAGASGF